MLEPTFSRKALTLLVALTLGGGAIAGCGSDDSGDGKASTDEVTKPADTAKKEKPGEVTPKKKKPASAGDKKKDAPDDAISKRPGGPKVSPTAP
jgi:hypothetical protein